jgi:hypothetical protein
MAESNKTAESEARIEIDEVKLSLESEELTQAEQDQISGAGGYGVEDDGNGS